MSRCLWGDSVLHSTHSTSHSFNCTHVQSSRVTSRIVCSVVLLLLMLLVAGVLTQQGQGQGQEQEQQLEQEQEQGLQLEQAARQQTVAM